jgi:hypothetical protein
VRLQLHALAYNLGNFLRMLATRGPIKDWTLTSLKDKPIKIGANVVSHGRYIAFQMAEAAIPRQMFQEILRLIAELLRQQSMVMRSTATDGRSAPKCLEKWPDQPAGCVKWWQQSAPHACLAVRSEKGEYSYRFIAFRGWNHAPNNGRDRIH